MKEHEERLLWESIRWSGEASNETPRKVIALLVDIGLIPSEKAAIRTLEKWSDEGCYDYGVTIDLGWKNPGTVPNRFKRPNGAKDAVGTAK